MALLKKQGIMSPGPSMIKVEKEKDGPKGKLRILNLTTKKAKQKEQGGKTIKQTWEGDGGSDDAEKNTSKFVKNSQNGNRRDKVVHERRRDSGNRDRLPPRSSSNMPQSQRWKERERNKQNSLPKQKSSQAIPTRPPSQGLNRGRNDGARPPSQASNRGRGDDSRRWSANEPDAGNSNLGRLKDNARDSRTKQPPLRFDKTSGKETRNINKRYTDKDLNRKEWIANSRERMMVQMAALSMEKEIEMAL